ncbi:nucleoside triphosphate pyrophosphohydrolase [Marinomonas balearica]|uniref:Nucleoside triphosphate pyrophosphohydrolase n=1 Tax=Marinomonas balearica TaxID=491947 RepID=A0A4R6M550_9GAMM|nr:nucleoside triphosphate pyrophosphohydrolase [Marinomonas balearica]TDO96364.1 ATP diphosphatase [Marinomonas balearica]
MNYSVDDLKLMMTQLRDPLKGCPWDIKQTFETIAPFTLEEAYEVVDAIHQGTPQALKDELGDLLFQVVFHAQMAKEQGDFCFEDVVSAIVAKMLRRHPHVFPLGTLESFGQPTELTESDLATLWDDIKQQEKAKLGASADVDDGILSSVSDSMPALMQAVKLQKKASKFGFDWDSIAPVFGKIREEIDELEEAVQSLSQSEIEDELGDVLFAVTNLARHLKVSPDIALMKTNLKFRRRFRYIERTVSAQNKQLTDCTLDELDKYWDQAKVAGM